jgi:GT2 family glycosyltransferase
MKITIIIVNWNSKDYLRTCLQHLSATCGDLDHEVIVVDGGSHDGCDRMLGEEFPWVIFIQAADNIGFARSNNLGFQRATGEVLVLLNPDTELATGALPRLVTQLDELPEAGILGPRLLNTDGTLQRSCVQDFANPLNQALGSELLYDWLPRCRLWKSVAVFEATEPVEVQALSGACMVMRSELFRDVGGFSPEYFMYAEDMDLCHRVHRIGLRMYHIPAAEVVHHGGGSSKTHFSKFSEVMIRESLHLYLQRNRGARSAFAYRVAMAGSAVVRLALLLPAWAIAAREVRPRRRDSIRKWIGVLRWAHGLEGWAGELMHQADPARAISNRDHPAAAPPQPASKV